MTDKKATITNKIRTLDFKRKPELLLPCLNIYAVTFFCLSLACIKRKENNKSIIKKSECCLVV